MGLKSSLKVKAGVGLDPQRDLHLWAIQTIILFLEEVVKNFLPDHATKAASDAYPPPLQLRQEQDPVDTTLANRI